MPAWTLHTVSVRATPRGLRLGGGRCAHPSLDARFVGAPAAADHTIPPCASQAVSQPQPTARAQPATSAAAMPSGRWRLLSPQRLLQRCAS